MLKLARQLYWLNPDPAYFDYYERALSIFSSKDEPERSHQ